MARIRSIHPGLATDEAYMSMSMATRAAWPLILTQCDDRGIFEWKPLVLKARIFPSDSLDFNEVLADLENLNCIKSFEFDNKRYGVVRNFSKYQRPKKPNSIYPFPAWCGNYTASSSLNSELVPNQSDISGEIPPQMEDGGDKMEDGGGVKKEDALPELSEAVSIWNDMAEAVSLPKIQRLTEPRSRALKARLSECEGIEGWRIAIAKVRDSPWMHGKNDRGWRADIDFILKPRSFTKLMEGSYDSTGNNQNSTSISELVYEALQPTNHES